MIKPSSKDEVLIKELYRSLKAWEPQTGSVIELAELLKDCDAYIATGSNNTSRYFEYYFGNYRLIIRRNKTSVAVLTGNETKTDLKNLQGMFTSFLVLVAAMSPSYIYQLDMISSRCLRHLKNITTSLIITNSKIITITILLFTF